MRDSRACSRAKQVHGDEAARPHELVESLWGRTVGGRVREEGMGGIEGRARSLAKVHEHNHITCEVPPTLPNEGG